MSELDDKKLVQVLEARSEIEAITIKAFLESESIEAAIRTRQIPMYDGIATVFNPIWGYVVVMESDSAKAIELIDNYMDSLNGDIPDEEGD